MDPNATLADLLAALAAGEHDRAHESAIHLQRWLKQGGFPPATLGPPTIGPEWHRTIADCACREARRLCRTARLRKESD